MEQRERMCSPDCEFFRCSQRKVFLKDGHSNRKEAICNWVGDPCEGSRCAYSLCGKGRLRQNGACGLYESAVPNRPVASTRSRRYEDTLEVKIPVISKPKILKRLRGH